MEDLLSAECQRQGAWGLLGEGIGAKLLCPKTGSILSKEHIFDPDGSLHISPALSYDSVLGLVRPNAHSHMLLSNGHTMPVPPNYFVHPHTGRVMPIVGNVAYDPASSTLVLTVDTCTGDGVKCESPPLPFVPYPTYLHSGQPLSRINLRGLRPGQRLQLGVPMADPDTGVPVPILGVTIHPDTGLVYPLGGLHMCPVTRQRQPIQIGSPMLESRTGNLVLTVGVSLDSATGAVLPVGGVLYDFFVEPLSGRMLRVGGASIRAGQLVPYGGGYQTLLDYKVLTEMFKALELLKPLTVEWTSDIDPLNMQLPRRTGCLENIPSAAKELQQAWGRRLHCHLQLQTRLEMLLDWSEALECDGGACGEMQLTGSNMCVAALVGMEYPDPGGSGLSVPVLGCQSEPDLGIRRPLAGTMEDADGKGVEAIRYGSQTVDPVTGIVTPVVGARLDISRKTVVPLTASYWLTMTEQTDSVQMEGLQKEICARNTYWQQQRLKEEDILSDLDSSLSQCVSDTQSYQWSVRSLREATLEMLQLSQAEAQRRTAGHLALILPPHVLHILTLGDEEEWDQHCAWQSELLSGLEKLEVCIQQLQQEQERYTAQENEWTASHTLLNRALTLQEVWEQCSAKQAELDTAVSALHAARLLSQLSADTAQAVLTGHFWYKEYGLVQFSGHRGIVNVIPLLREKALPLLERISQLLQDKHYPGLCLNPCHHKLSDLQTKQSYGLDVASRVWTESVPAAVQVNSTQSLREPDKTQSQDTGLEMSSGPTHPSQRHTLSSGLQSHESQIKKEKMKKISIPLIPEEEWNKLLEQSSLFNMLKGVELQMKTWASGAGLVRGDHNEKGNSYVDVLDAQWKCEGELIPLCASNLNPREYLVYQHGLFVMQTMSNLQLTPVVTLQITTSLPSNNYIDNAFRNSFFYQEAENTLFVRRQRLQSVGGFSLLLLHCLCHIKLKDMTSDSSPAFQRLFFKVLQASLGSCSRPV
ncbi:hypothetical protein WMY93_028733 [Mugilogobius chulae]|uniref:Uncharacterized protein n=1 Tax=Mugilogobius chulae TaxID=88201 RepID=A0AAW0MY89_9GOBI